MKKYYFIIINSIIIFLLATLSHFIYNFLESDITSIFFPVNESIWEHMKLLFTPFLLDVIIIYFYFKKVNIVYHNLLLGALLSSIFSIIFYLLIYLPIYISFKTNLIFDISLLFITILLSQFLMYYMLNKKINYYCIISLTIIVIIYIIFGFLTYKPFRNFLFYDKKEHKYGVNIYVLSH